MTTPRGGSGEVLVHVEPVMGTVVSFQVSPGGAPPDHARQAIGAACQLLHRLDAMFSTWAPESPMSRLRRGEAALGEVPGEIAEVLELCRQARELSGGWFDPWSLPGGVDPTGLVKGWAVGGAMALLRQAGVGSAMVNGGGDIAVHGSPPQGGPWRIGIRHPWRREGLACVLAVGPGQAVATSGSYERGLHLFDPKKAAAVQATASATVTGPSPALADALATAVAVGGDAALALVTAVDGYEAYLIRLDGSETATPGAAFA